MNKNTRKIEPSSTNIYVIYMTVMKLKSVLQYVLKCEMKCQAGTDYKFLK